MCLLDLIRPSEGDQQQANGDMSSPTEAQTPGEEQAEAVQPAESAATDPLSEAAAAVATEEEAKKPENGDVATTEDVQIETKESRETVKG